MRTPATGSTPFLVRRGLGRSRTLRRRPPGPTTCRASKSDVHRQRRASIPVRRRLRPKRRPTGDPGAAPARPGRKTKRTARGIPTWSPTVVLISRFVAYVCKSGRVCQFSTICGRTCWEGDPLCLYTRAGGGRRRGRRVRARPRRSPCPPPSCSPSLSTGSPRAGGRPGALPPGSGARGAPASKSPPCVSVVHRAQRP